MGMINDIDVDDGAECNCLLCQMNRILLEEVAKNEPVKNELPTKDDLDQALDHVAYVLNTNGEVSKEALETILRANDYEESVVEEDDDGELTTVNTKNLDFSYALCFLKEGYRVARAGWNGKGMFLYYVPAVYYPAQRNEYGTMLGVFPNDMVPYGAYIAMKTAQNNVVPWLASQTDMLADDWVVLV